MDSESVQTETIWADNTIWARGMTTEAVRGGSGLEHGGGSSRGRVRQEDRNPVA